MKRCLSTSKCNLQKRQIIFVLNEIFYPDVKKKINYDFSKIPTDFGDNYNAYIQKRNMNFTFNFFLFCMCIIQINILEKMNKK